MTTKSLTLFCIAALSIGQALAQVQPPPAVPGSPRRSPQPPSNGTAASLTKFNLDFHGGTPKDLVAAIEAASGRPLNAIVPDEVADTKLPALRMSNVDAAQLFAALSVASRKSEVTQGPTPYGYSTISVSCGFRTEGAPSDDSIWYFYAEKPPHPPEKEAAKICRFYSLAPYLENGMKVDDITTAIQTGWKMLGETSTPAISFHKDTKLLIAVGDPRKLDLIDEVLKALKAQQTPDLSSSMAEYYKALRKGLVSAPAADTNKPPQEPKTEK